ncbi:acyl carrier protein [Hyunsoonleella pacifica]|uniref:Acyl carrier protein n=1 Tax=Hyunsoonleella pacifica TaxID=1080224 RepID=A0A4Q9FQ82_9FLAO|nr:acyl carrier protein [Hyunsoonleella pacifica]TBN17655.1 acyl carrier protein [Hyunsoonleella pacifica]GGD10100.1 acyl carrier protein [Hyunsoonleella pacifica]
MKNRDILEKISKSFSTILEHNNFTLTESTTSHDVDGWESITHMMIINDIEKSFNIKFKLMDLMNMDTVGDLIKAIQKEQNIIHS